MTEQDAYRLRCTARAVNGRLDSLWSDLVEVSLDEDDDPRTNPSCPALLELVLSARNAMALAEAELNRLVSAS